MIDLDQLQEAMKNATPGPYNYDAGNGDVESRSERHFRVSMCHRDDNVTRAEHYKYFQLDGEKKSTDDDMEYIAMALNAVPQLIHEIKTLRNLVQSLRTASARQPKS